MEIIFEFILELIFEGSIEASKSSKTPRFIRYLLIVIISLFFIAVIGLILLVGILTLKENLIAGILMILIALFMLVMSIIKFRKTYLIRASRK